VLLAPPLLAVLYAYKARQARTLSWFQSQAAVCACILPAVRTSPRQRARRWRYWVQKDAFRMNVLSLSPCYNFCSAAFIRGNPLISSTGQFRAIKDY